MNLSSPGLHLDVRFEAYPEFATAESIATRLLDPLAREIVRRHLNGGNAVLKPQLFEMINQHYLIYIPRHKPASGYGLFVFVPPGPKAPMPAGWQAVLDRYGLIFVSADGSGNDSDFLGERVPAALVAYGNVERLFAIDPARVVIGGFSGGSRVAERIALAYPDLFSHLLLNAGSDPLGNDGALLPSPDLMRTIQSQTSIAYLTGDQDEASLSLDDASQASVRHWCIRTVANLNEHGRGHEPASALGLEWALRTLLEQSGRDFKSIADCQAQRRAELDAELEKARASMAAGHRQEARQLIIALDRRFGGEAETPLIKLADDCACGLLDPK